MQEKKNIKRKWKPISNVYQCSNFKIQSRKTWPGDKKTISCLWSETWPEDKTDVGVIDKNGEKRIEIEISPPEQTLKQNPSVFFCFYNFWKLWKKIHRGSQLFPVFWYFFENCTNYYSFLSIFDKRDIEHDKEQTAENYIV